MRIPEPEPDLIESLMVEKKGKMPCMPKLNKNVDECSKGDSEKGVK